MELEKLKFKEAIIPRISYWFLLIGTMFMLIGAVSQFVVVSENKGRMPVWINGTLNSSSHFTITNASEVKNIHLADIYYFRGYIWSLGDFLLYFGFIIFILHMLTIAYNFFINSLIQRRERDKWLSSTR